MSKPHIISLRLSFDELLKLQEAAANAEMTVSGYIRACLARDVPASKRKKEDV